MRSPSTPHAHCIALALALASVLLIGAATATALHRTPQSGAASVGLVAATAGACASLPPAFGGFRGSRSLGAPTGPIPVPLSRGRARARSST